jgi:circadian clock protein KaiC
MEVNQNNIASNISNAEEFDELSDRILVEQEDDQQMTLPRLSTGIAELDDILQGGFIPWRTYLVRGSPGSGKTTLGLHFLTAGAIRNEITLYISVGEPEEQIRKNARSIGLDMNNVAFLDLSTHSEFFAEFQSQRAFDPELVEQESITQKIIQQIEALKPQRVFLDSMTQLRLLLPDIFQFRKQVLSFLHFLIEQQTTVLFTSESSDIASDEDFQSICDGIINLQFVEEERTLSVTKYRGSGFPRGQHAIRLTGKGMEVFPRLLPERYKREFTVESISSGVPELDEMLHGGLERGTTSLVTGPSGVGKTTIGLQFMKEAAGKGERSLVYTFEENEETIIRRCESINIPVGAMIERGTLIIKQIEPLVYTPDEFAYHVRLDVEKEQTSIVMIDSVAGYSLSVRGKGLTSHIYDLSKYLRNMGVAVLLINEVEAITGEFRATEVGISYMADNILFLRYLEMDGEMHRAIGVLKKRLTDFERSLREIDFGRYGIKIGKPLKGLRGILSGAPYRVDHE